MPPLVHTRRNRNTQYRPAVFFTLFSSLCALIGLMIGAFCEAIICLTMANKRRREALLSKLTTSWIKAGFKLNSSWHIGIQTADNAEFLRTKQYILVANHQSVIDPFLFYLLPISPFKWLIKQWIFFVPFLGPILEMQGQIHVSAATENTLSKCEDALKEGWSLAFFPEGTRSETGTLGAFKPGAFWLSAKHDIPIVPIVIIGSRQIIPKYKKLLCREATILVRILPPVFPTKPAADPRALKSEVERIIGDEIARLNTELNDHRKDDKLIPSINPRADHCRQTYR